MTTDQMKTPRAALDATATTIKSEEHFWAHRDELVSDLQQQPGEGIHGLDQHICDLVTKSKFMHAPTKEMLKIMVLQHAVRYHGARDWIRHQDLSQLSYQALLSHCKMLESWCEQFQKAKERGHANLASITATTSSLHMNAYCCKKCGYSHPNNKCPAKGQQCYACSGYDHFTVLCQQKGCCQNNKHTPQRGYQPRCNTSSHCRHCTSCSPCRHRCKIPSQHSHSRTPSHSPSCSTLPWCSAHLNRCSTPHRYYQDALEVIPADCITTGSWAEGQLYTESASNGQVAFYTHLHLPAQNGTKAMTVKIDPGTQVNTIPLSRYHVLYPNKLTKSRYSKAKALLPTHHTCISHNGSPKPFLGHFIVKVSHATKPNMYPIHFYIFEDTTAPHILLSYATSERLGIISFQVPNLAATTKIDYVPLPPPSSQRKTAKCVTFWDPIIETAGSKTSTNAPSQLPWQEEDCFPQGWRSID